MVQEGIEIHETAVSILLGVIFLSMFIVIFRYNHTIQSVIEKEQTEQALDQAYAKVAAYDDSDINGQDVLSFLTRYKGELPVIIADPKNGLSTSYVITNDVNELSTIIAGSSDADWPYIIYQYDAVNSGSDDLVKRYTAQQVYNDDADIRLYLDGSPETDTTADTLTAQQVIDEFSDFLKNYRKVKCDKTDGLYGTWHSIVYYKDVSCREPECIKVWPVE